jgi:integrase
MRQRGSILKRCEHPRSSWTRCRHSWSVVVDLGEDEKTGKRRQLWRTVASGDDPQRELTRLLREHDQGHLAAEARPVTVREYLEGDWLPHMRTRIRESTWVRYNQLITSDVLPVIGGARLGRLRPHDVQLVVDKMVDKGLAARTVVQCYRVLSSALSQAVRWQMIPTNPATAVRPPRIERAELVIPTAEQVRKLLTAAEGSWVHLPILLAAATGMRRGEVFGLRWGDVDTDAGVLRITGSLQRVGGKLRVVEPKTPRARRTVAIPRSVMDVLKSHRKEQTERRLLLGEGWTDSDLVVERGDGQPRDPDTITHYFADIATQVKMPGIRFHDLRHAYATSLLRGGVHPKIVSEALGHASTAFTLDTYSHVVPSMQEAAAEAIGAALDL